MTEGSLLLQDVVCLIFITSDHLSKVPTHEAEKPYGRLY